MTGFVRPWISHSLLRTVAGLGLGLSVGLACNINVQSIFTCTTNEECVAEAGEGALCEPNSLCSVPDPACMPAMKRWFDRSGDLSGQCYDESHLGTGTESVAGSGSGDSGGSGGTGEPTPTPDPSDDDGSTTNPVEDTGEDDSTTDPPGTDDGDSSTGNGMSCMELFGRVPAFELCDETPEDCTFNAMTDGGNCDDICMMFGSTCVTAFLNDMSDCASQGMEITCADTAGDNICVCAK